MIGQSDDVKKTGETGDRIKLAHNALMVVGRRRMSYMRLVRCSNNIDVLRTGRLNEWASAAAKGSTAICD